MKKLNTNLKNIKDRSEKSGIIIRSKNKLEEYKVFFEIFSSVLLAIMSLVISFVGLKTNERNKDIYQKQLEILENDREPYFTLEWIEESDEIYDEDNKSIFEIRNMGGHLDFGSAYIIDIYSLHLLGKKVGVKVVSPDVFPYEYDEVEKKFVIQYIMKNGYIWEIANKLEDKLKDVYNYNIWYSDIGIYAEIRYINYQNEMKTNLYEILAEVPYGCSLLMVDESEIYDYDCLVTIAYGDDVDMVSEKILENLEDLNDIK